jgi:hypothetical protein
MLVRAAVATSGAARHSQPAQWLACARTPRLRRRHWGAHRTLPPGLIATSFFEGLAALSLTLTVSTQRAASNSLLHVATRSSTLAEHDTFSTYRGSGSCAVRSARQLREIKGQAQTRGTACRK